MHSWQGPRSPSHPPEPVLLCVAHVTRPRVRILHAVGAVVMIRRAAVLLRRYELHSLAGGRLLQLAML